MPLFGAVGKALVMAVLVSGALPPDAQAGARPCPAGSPASPGCGPAPIQPAGGVPGGVVFGK